MDMGPRVNMDFFLSFPLIPKHSSVLGGGGYPSGKARNLPHRQRTAPQTFYHPGSNTKLAVQTVFKSAGECQEPIWFSFGLLIDSDTI